MNLKHRVGWLTTRSLLVLFFAPTVQEALFAPFLTPKIFTSFDPWTSWLEIDGRSDAFPYGPIMVLVHSLVPFLVTLTSYLISGVDSITTASLAISCILLVFDFTVTKILLQLCEGRLIVQRIFLYSPITLYVTYILGQNDLLPSCALLAACLYILRNKWHPAGLYLGLAVGMKFSLFLAIPFVLIYLAGRGKKQLLIHFSQTFVPFALVAISPTFWSPGYFEMVVRSPEFIKSLDFAISIGSFQLYLLPIGYTALLLGFWSIGRISLLHLVSFISLGMLIVAMMQLRSIGWFLWGLFPAIFVLSKFRSRILYLFLTWQILAVISFIYKSEGFKLRFFPLLHWSSNPTIISLIFTLNFTIGILFIYKFVAETSLIIDPFSLSKKPLSIGIAGDSGVGKDTLSTSLVELVNDGAIACILGDDYHIAERANLFWKSKTHLNISANDLLRFNRDVCLAAERKPVSSKHYDHSTGKFTPERQIYPADILVVNGLHALSIPAAQKFDVRVFLQMEEGLRVTFKIARDLETRGVFDEDEIIANIRRRKQDSNKFITNQISTADLVFEVKLHLENDFNSIYYEIKSNEDLLLFELHRALQGLNPDISKIYHTPQGELILALEPSQYTQHHHEAVLLMLIPRLGTLLPNPNYALSNSSLLAAITLIAATRQREFLNG